MRSSRCGAISDTPPIVAAHEVHRLLNADTATETQNHAPSQIAGCERNAAC
jgi:hypothetical protein